MWVATWGGGVKTKMVNQNTFTDWSSKSTDPSKRLIGDEVNFLFEDSQNRIWINSFHKGLNLYVPQENKMYYFDKYSPKRMLKSDQILSVSEDKHGKIWVSSQDNGIQTLKLNDQLEIIQSNHIQHLSHKDSLIQLEGPINCSLPDNKGNVWIASQTHGLIYYDMIKQTSEVYDTENGLHSNNITSILSDNQGDIWVSSNRGLSQINPQTKQVINFTQEDGLQADEFYTNSSYKASNGDLYFGGINDYNKFNPSNFNTHTKHASLYITDVIVDGKTIPNPNRDDNIRFFNNLQLIEKHNQNDIKIVFSCLNFTQSSRDKYFYKLENYDEKWIAVNTEQFAEYQNLPPGDYTFKLRSSSGENTPSTSTQFQLTVRKPWYLSQWAFLSYLAIFLTLVLWRRNMNLARQKLNLEIEFGKMELDKMQEINTLKTRFYTNISHELKTPLTLIISPLRQLIKKYREDEKETSKLKVMLKNAEHLYRLINQILDLSKIEAGKDFLKATEDDLVDFTKRVALNFSPYAEEKNIHFELKLPQQAIPVFFEKKKLEKVITNLLSNAFKYTPDYGKISLTMNESFQFVEVQIKDSGMGISKEEQEYIFNRFYQGKNAKSISSTGIGLELVKQLVEIHKGEILLDSTPGQGSMFTIKLLKGRQHLKPNEISKTQDSFVLSEESRIELKSFVSKSPNQKVDKNQTQKNKPRILIVEDNEDLRKFLIDILYKRYDVYSAENGSKGLKVLQEVNPEIVITDAMMPVMDGYEMTQRIKEDPNFAHTFVIMLSVKAHPDNVSKGFKFGADAYIAKPFKPERLELQIQNFLRSRKDYKKHIAEGQHILQQASKKEALVNYDKGDEEFIKQFASIVNENLSNSQLKIDDICREMGVSKSFLYRKIKTLLQQSTNEFIRITRLKRAAYLLRESNFKVAEITYQVGFNDLQYFRKCFKGHYSMTPSEYQKKYRENNANVSS